MNTQLMIPTQESVTCGDFLADYFRLREMESRGEDIADTLKEFQTTPPQEDEP